jgi:predicted N-acetyltransferase YhbS
MPASVHIDHLCRHPQHLAATARLIWDEFWSDGQGLTEAFLAEHLRGTSPERLPLSLLAHHEGRLVGTVTLIDNDDARRTHLHPWLAAMVVVPDWRGRGVGTRLVNALARDAARLGFRELFLGTDGPGFYARLGAQVHERVNEQFSILRLPLTESAP